MDRPTSPRRALALVATGLFALARCASPVAIPPTPASKPAPIRVPEGCMANQSGNYVHEDNPSFHYLATDDGGTLSLAVWRSAPDGSVGPTDAGLLAQVELHRTPDGFIGETHAQGFTVTGRPCPVTLPTRITACPDGGLLISAAEKVYIDETCHSPKPAPRGLMVEHRLVRARPGSQPP